MTQFKGTPGPWYYESNSRAIGPLIQGDDDQCFHMIEHVAHVEYQLNEDIQHSNARLIAAAPELLEALCNLIECYERWAELNEEHRGYEFDKALAVIAKATGETK
ncbi:hypothetical protein PQZ62_gp57 [Klebsiella phage MEW1]|uniref:Uncharacterized protein n=1 Tax=Klebsiella phage MEW1 TaxID=2776813 RepID=A0A7M1IDR1_9CAUD|nr:hypothetical protein PQZ62_gp57 [Klebsiella phage MEW1]QOQ37714.1 hypothetical protein MEW1_57 [Klebsiella phage MEW1]